jgi:hypothetical protein
MKRIAGLALVTVGIGMVRWFAARRHEKARDRGARNRWLMITIDCPPERLASRSDLPEPIARLGDAVDTKVSRAPGDRGTELGARPSEVSSSGAGGVAGFSGENFRRTVRWALRQSRSLIETGEVLIWDQPPAAYPRPTKKILELAGRRGGRL